MIAPARVAAYDILRAVSAGNADLPTAVAFARAGLHDERDRALAAIHPWLTEQGIYSRGRFGAWRYEIGNTDHCVMQGVEIAEYLARGTPERTWALLPGEETRARID